MRSRLLRSSLVVRILGTAILAFCLLNPFPGLDIDWYKSDLGDGFPLENCLANAKACIYRRSIFSLVSVNKRSFFLYLIQWLIDTWMQTDLWKCPVYLPFFFKVEGGVVRTRQKMVDKSVLSQASSCSILCQNCYYFIKYKTQLAFSFVAPI